MQKTVFDNRKITWTRTLRGKLFLVLTGLGGVLLGATLLGSLWMMNKSIATIESQTRSNLSIASRLVSINAEAALLFRDQAIAQRLLLSFETEPVVVGAIMFDANDSEMARYLKTAAYRQALLHGEHDERNHIIRYRRQITHQGEYLGRLIVIADISRLFNQFNWHIAMIAILQGGLLLLLLLLLLLFLNRFNQRLARLGRLTQKIHDEQNFESRVVMSGHDELSEYSSRFNAMLDVIQLQTSELEVFNLQLVQQTLHDSLTGLPNRLYFKVRLKEMMNDHQASRQPFSLTSFDIDHFKRINDAFGHQAGDEAICLFAHELKSLASATVFFARIGGDEFIGLYRGDHDGMRMSALYEDINHNFKQKIRKRLGAGHYSCSAGIACMPADGSTIRDLMKASDIALYQAKANGRDHVLTLRQSVGTRLSSLMTSPSETKQRNFDLGRVRPLFQPIYDVTEQMIGVECLATYAEPQGKLVHAFSFIPWLEEEGLISLLDLEMLGKSLRESHHIRTRNHPDLMLFHNFSLDTIAMPDFPERIALALTEHQCKPEHLVLEVTETIQLNAGTIRQLRRVSELGCILCIDDFGAGFTNPGYFRKLPWGMVKIDKEYIHSINTDMSRKLIDALFRIARLMDMRVVAEGVERQRDFIFLRDQGCDYFQGYYFARPGEPLAIASRHARAGC
ncbi:MAG: EAL domain-containing protein [Thiothrix sp.]|nr:EAL domain-containing protein [Thiothrix sp.]